MSKLSYLEYIFETGTEDFEEKNSVVVLCQDMILGMTPFYCRYPDLNLKKHPIARLAGRLESRV